MNIQTSLQIEFLMSKRIKKDSERKKVNLIKKRVTHKRKFSAARKEKINQSRDFQKRKEIIGSCCRRTDRRGNLQGIRIDVALSQRTEGKNANFTRK